MPKIIKPSHPQRFLFGCEMRNWWGKLRKAWLTSDDIWKLIRLWILFASHAVHLAIDVRHIAPMVFYLTSDPNFFGSLVGSEARKSHPRENKHSLTMGVLFRKKSGPQQQRQQQQQQEQQQQQQERLVFYTYDFRRVGTPAPASYQNLRFRSINFGRYQRRGGQQLLSSTMRWNGKNSSQCETHPRTFWKNKHEQASCVISPYFKRTYHNCILLSLHTLCRSVELSFLELLATKTGSVQQFETQGFLDSIRQSWEDRR